jgi:hypothetical protein
MKHSEHPLAVEMLTFSMLSHLFMTFCVTMQLSVQLLAAEIQSPAFTLYYMLTSAASTVGAMEKTEPEIQSTF